MKTNTIMLAAIPQVKLIDCDDIDIIENDNNKNYGVSNIHPVDESFVIDMWKTRLDINSGDNYSEWYENLSENGISHWDSAMNITDAFKSHLNFWMQSDNTEIPETVYVMTTEELSLVLKAGFDANRLLVKIAD